MKVNARVNKHREKLRGEQCSRLEVWLAVSLIETARTLARQQRKPLRRVVQEALSAHFSSHAGNATASRYSPWPA